MNLKQVNKTLAKLNPYTQKAEIRQLLKRRRELLAVDDILTGNSSQSMRKQSGL